MYARGASFAFSPLSSSRQNQSTGVAYFVDRIHRIAKKQIPKWVSAFLVRWKGLEPLTYWFVASHSIQLSYRREYGADDEARTRYLHLGKVALYQMSYIRKCKKYYTYKTVSCQ